MGLEYLLLGKPHEVGGAKILAATSDRCAVFVKQVAVHAKQKCSSGDVLCVCAIP